MHAGYKNVCIKVYFLQRNHVLCLFFGGGGYLEELYSLVAVQIPVNLQARFLKSLSPV